MSGSFRARAELTGPWAVYPCSRHGYGAEWGVANEVWRSRHQSKELAGLGVKRQTDKLTRHPGPSLPAAFPQVAGVLADAKGRSSLGQRYSARLADLISLGFALLPLSFWGFPPVVWLQSGCRRHCPWRVLTLHLQVINLAEMVAFNSYGWLIKMSTISFLKDSLWELYFLS